MVTSQALAADIVGLLCALAGDCENMDGWEDAAQPCEQAAPEIERLHKLAKANNDLARRHAGTIAGLQRKLDEVVMDAVAFRHEKLAWHKAKLAALFNLEVEGAKPNRVAIIGALMMEVVEDGRWSLRFDFGTGDDAHRPMLLAVPKPADHD